MTNKKLLLLRAGCCSEVEGLVGQGTIHIRGGEEKGREGEGGKWRERKNTSHPDIETRPCQALVAETSGCHDLYMAPKALSISCQSLNIKNLETSQKFR